MSGVTGNQKIQSRKDFREILKTAKEVISDFPGFVSIEPTGSYNSDKNKKTFGDIDLITHIDGSLYGNDKKKVKSALAKHFTAKSDKTVVPFESEKYAGKRYYNSGEIITISLNTDNPSILACQVDYMIAMDASETKFKKDLLDMPAAKQGIVLGLVKTAIIEESPKRILRRMGIYFEGEDDIRKDQELEFNLSSKEIQLRLVTYDAVGSFKQKSREIVWTGRDFGELENILPKFDLSLSFDKLVAQAKKVLKKTRSARRMAGVFKSMISIKSGEVGKQKGIDKQKALDKVQRIFGESSENIKFEDYINEMAKINGIVDRDNIGKNKWLKYYKKDIGTSKVKLINDKVSNLHLKVYRTLNNFFLVNEENEYMGHIEFSLKDKILNINKSNSDKEKGLDRGFYVVMFNIMLSQDDIKEIISDKQLSTQAVKAYKKLNGELLKQDYKVRVKIFDEYSSNLDDISSDLNARFSVTETYEGALKENWEEFDRRYNNINPDTGCRSSWADDYEMLLKNTNRWMFSTDQIYL